MAYSRCVYAELYQPKLLDGVPIEAVDTYLNPKAHQIDLGVSLYPFDSYYTGISVNLGYTQHLSQNFAWDIFHASYYFSFQNGLTTELAESFGVNPSQIERLSYGVSSNIHYFYSYGKFIFLQNSIRYFRGSFLLGAGMLGTTLQGGFAGNVGTSIEVFFSDVFSCKVNLQDSIMIPSLKQFVTFSLESGISF